MRPEAVRPAALMVVRSLAGLCCVASVLSPVAGGATHAAAPVYGYTLVSARPHDPASFTQGLEYRDGYLLESGILGAKPALRKVALASGRTLARADLPGRYFAEGATALGGRVYQLTWTQKTAFVYDLRTLRRLRTFRYAGEGWGLANDGTRLIMSDGSAVLRFRDPRTFAVTRTLTVRDDGRPVEALNELEVVKGLICANVFPSERIACIDARSGAVRYWLDLTGILPSELRSDEGAVPNGIAYDAKGDRLFVTGKLWPRLFEVRRGARLPG